MSTSSNVTPDRKPSPLLGGGKYSPSSVIDGLVFYSAKTDDSSSKPSLVPEDDEDCLSRIMEVSLCSSTVDPQQVSLATLMYHQRWDEAQERLQLYQREASQEISLAKYTSAFSSPHQNTGAYPLHLAVKIRPLPPVSFVQLLLDCYPPAVKIPEATFGFYPLHLCCKWTSPPEQQGTYSFLSSLEEVARQEQSDDISLDMSIASFIANVLEADDTKQQRQEKKRRRNLEIMSSSSSCLDDNQSQIIDLLVRAYPDSVRIRDRFNGMLPLHIVASTTSSSTPQLTKGEWNTLELLLDTWPQSVQERDDHGETPVEICQRKANFCQQDDDVGDATTKQDQIVHPLLRYEHDHPVTSSSEENSSDGTVYNDCEEHIIEFVGSGSSSNDKSRHVKSSNSSRAQELVEDEDSTSFSTPSYGSRFDASKELAALLLTARMEAAISETSFSDSASLVLGNAVDTSWDQIEIEQSIDMLKAEMKDWVDDKVRELDHILTPPSSPSRKEHLRQVPIPQMEDKEGADRFVPIPEENDMSPPCTISIVKKHVNFEQCTDFQDNRRRITSPLARSTNISLKLGVFQLHLGKGKKLFKWFRRPNPFYEVSMESWELGFPMWDTVYRSYPQFGVRNTSWNAADMNFDLILPQFCELPLRIAVYDCNKKGKRTHRLIGEYHTNGGELLNAKLVQRFRLMRGKKIKGQLQVTHVSVNDGGSS